MPKYHTPSVPTEELTLESALAALGRAGRKVQVQTYVHIYVERETSDELVAIHSFGTDGRPNCYRDGRTVDVDGLFRARTPGGLVRAVSRALARRD